MYTELFTGHPLGNLQHTLWIPLSAAAEWYLGWARDTTMGVFHCEKQPKPRESEDPEHQALRVKLKLDSVTVHRGQSGTVFTWYPVATQGSLQIEEKQWPPRTDQQGGGSFKKRNSESWQFCWSSWLRPRLGSEAKQVIRADLLEGGCGLWGMGSEWRATLQIYNEQIYKHLLGEAEDPAGRQAWPFDVLLAKENQDQLGKLCQFLFLLLGGPAFLLIPVTM